jgi:hypothetical protein
MKHDGYEVSDITKCMVCEMTASFYHISGAIRKDGKKTVIYKCPHNHTTFLDIDDFRAKGVPKNPGKSPKKKPVKSE